MLTRSLAWCSVVCALVCLAQPALAQQPEDEPSEEAAPVSEEGGDAAAEEDADAAAEESGDAAAEEGADAEAEEGAESADDDTEGDDADETDEAGDPDETPMTEESGGEETGDAEGMADKPEEQSPEDDDESSDDAPDVVAQRVEVTTGVERIPASDVQVAWNEDLEDYMKRYAWKLAIGGYIRTQFQSIEDDPGGTFGRNDGFILANARLTLQGSMRRSLGFRFQIDAAVDRRPVVSDPAQVNSPDAEVVTRLKDGYAFWFPMEYVGLVVGQFKAPFDIEELQSTSSILFIHRSVGSRGVKGVEGFNVEGLSISRELGAMLTSGDPIYPMADDEPEGFGFSYSIAATNGTDINRSLNDNDEFAYYGRGALHWGEYIALGGAYFSNDATVGRPPDIVGEEENGFTGDLTATVAGATLVGSYIQTTTAAPEIETEAERVGRAYQVAVGYQEPLFGFQPTFRLAWYDPSADFEGDSSSTLANDELTYYTIGLNYNPSYPVRLMLNYTIAQEQEQRELENNRFDALLQVMW